MRLRRLVIGLAMAAAAVGVQAGTAAAAPEPAAAPRPTAQVGPQAWPCGWHTRPVSYGYDEGWYNHCGSPRICIWVDMNTWTGRPDFAMEVGQGSTFLGTTFYVRNAWYVGLPHPSLRCRIY